MTFSHEAILASTWDNVQLYGLQLLQIISVSCGTLRLTSHTSCLFPSSKWIPHDSCSHSTGPGVTAVYAVSINNGYNPWTESRTARICLFVENTQINNLTIEIMLAMPYFARIPALQDMHMPYFYLNGLQMNIKCRMWHYATGWVVSYASKDCSAFKVLRTPYPMMNCHIPTDLMLQQHCCENFECRMG
jgi:hypothetical protein